ncbi:MAG: Vps62-related protein [Terriglobus roseus]|nr:Vps62-related protein [Terriglobus roseus]
MVWLHSEDPYLPSDLDTHISNTQPENNFTVVSGAPSPLDVTNLNALNDLGGSAVYLTSKDDVTTGPTWLQGNAPDADGKTAGTTASVIVYEHGDGTVDAFYMYFYSYNWGGIVRIPILDIELGNYGNHVGDWEHNMVRFVNGTPAWVWYSQHANGQAFSYEATEKSGLRPVAYSANGSHANYAIAGTHDHTIPNLNGDDEGVLTDFTDQGKLWDPLLSAGFYSYAPSPETFTAYDGAAATGFLYFNGKWGDQQYPDSDPRQKELFGNAKYSGGPTGPRDKQLSRTDVCPDNGNDCILRTELGP